MEKRIVGFGQDAEGDWVAVLECGHPQHVRHQPPFINRAWVVSAAGRAGQLGKALNCVRCNAPAGMPNALSQDTHLSKENDMTATAPLPGPTARVIQNFGVPPAKVFSAWLEPELIERWMFGPALRDEEIVHLEVDPKEGGHFSFRVRRDGQEVDHIGEYLDIDAPTHLLFTWGIAGTATASTVDVAIEAMPEGSRLTLTHRLDPDWADFVQRTEEGWRKMLQQQAVALSGSA